MPRARQRHRRLRYRSDRHVRLPFAAQGSHHRTAGIAKQVLKKHAERCDEPQKEEGGGDLSHRFIPLIIHSETHVFEIRSRIVLERQHVHLLF